MVNCEVIFRPSFAVLALLMSFIYGGSAHAQEAAATQQDAIKVVARPSADSITLRWAPSNVNQWITANRIGYIVERFTLVRKGKVVQPIERKQLTSSPLRPWPEDQWEPFVTNKYAMVAAQALYGDSFEMKIEQGSMIEIVNKAQENEQRFSVALFCADMSPAVARAMGLYFNDKQIEKDVKYLYRVSVLTGTDTLRGSTFVDTSEKYILPAVTEVSAEASGNVVSLRWNQVKYANFYTTFLVERAEDGRTFIPVTDIAGVTLSKKGEESKYQYAVDTVASIEKTYSYRVRGITPFGENGPASTVVTAKGNKVATANVFITTALSTDNKSVDLQWEFSEAQNDAIEGFEVTRSAASSGPYKNIHKGILPPSSRFFKDTTPQQSNYYKVKVKTLDGREIISMPYLALLVDSIPPAIPDGLAGRVDDEGKVSISWKANPDSDILGYRVYRAYYASEEFALVTPEPLKDTTFSDKVELKNLNEKIHYRLMAIDRNQNHSGLSVMLSLSLPDKVPPMPPVWLPAQSTKEGVVLTWQPGGSPDVVKYDVYIRNDRGQWSKIASTAAGADSVYRYTDNALNNNDVQHYTVIAVDEAGLESPPAPAVTGFKLPVPKPGVIMKNPVVDRQNKKIVLNWSYGDKRVVSYRVYRKVNDGAIQLFKTVKENQFVDDRLVAGSKYSYSVMAVFDNGSLSQLSNPIEVDF